MPMEPLSAAVKLEPLTGSRARATALDPGLRFALDWDRYVQLAACAAACRQATNVGTETTVADIGSADGVLCLFLPQCVVDVVGCDTANGGIFDAPSETYDLVVAYGLLEQIEPRKRGIFIASMARACRTACILNFALPTSSTAQKVVAGITGDSLISRHVSWGLPYSSTVHKQFEDIGFSCRAMRHTSQALWATFSALKHVSLGTTSDIGRYLIEESGGGELPESPPDDPLYETVIATRKGA
jgi:hypothetical protein